MSCRLHTEKLLEKKTKTLPKLTLGRELERTFKSSEVSISLAVHWCTCTK